MFSLKCTSFSFSLFILRNNMVHDEGPDGPRSWVIAVACCFLNMMVFGIMRLQGMLFVATMPRYGVDRQQASFPYVISNFIRCIVSPLVGYLGHRLGVRVVTTVGCLLTAIGVGICFLAEDIGSFTLLWGLVYGLGFGFGNTLLPVIINQYFAKHRATASGISYSGASLGSFILPPILEILLATYGLSGTFLILGGLILNCVPAALLLRKPDYVITPTNIPIHQKDNILKNEKHWIPLVKKVEDHNVENGANLNVITEEMKQNGKYLDPISTVNSSQTSKEIVRSVFLPTFLSNCFVRLSISDLLYFKPIFQNTKDRSQVNQTTLDCDFSILASYETDQDSVFDEDNILPHVHCVTSHSLIRRFSNCRESKNSDIQYPKNYKDTYVNHVYQPDNDEGLETKCSESHEDPSRSSTFSIICDPVFILIAIIYSLYLFTFACMITVIFDFARDINVDETNTKYILMLLSVGDFVGRLSLGWVTDHGYMTRTGFAAFCFLCQGVLTTATAWTTGFVSLVVVSTLYGLSEAGLMIIFPLIIAEFIDEDKQTVAISSSNFLAGPLCLAVAPLIGYFRDEIGSYDCIFYGIGLLSVLCSAACLLTPCLVKYRKRS